MPKTLHDLYVNIVRDTLNEAGKDGLSVDTAALMVVDALGLGSDFYAEVKQAN